MNKRVNETTTSRRPITVVLMGLSLCSVAVFAQTPTKAAAKATTTKAATKPTTDTESPEHKFARQRCEEWKEGLDESESDLRGATEEYNKILARVEAARQNGDSDKAEAWEKSAADWRKTLKNLATYKEEYATTYALWANRLEHVDDCVKAYRRTIDKKVSALTTRETGLVDGCKVLELYPPHK